VTKVINGHEGSAVHDQRHVNFPSTSVVKHSDLSLPLFILKTLTHFSLVNTLFIIPYHLWLLDSQHCQDIPEEERKRYLYIHNIQSHSVSKIKHAAFIFNGKQACLNM